jgi:filamentous hemagglutinin family protein
VLLTTTALLALGAMPGGAEPRGPSVVGGSANITGTGTGNVTVNSTTNNTIINWNTFNIGAGESVRFNEPSSTSIVLNRVTGGLGPSEILGTLTANGRVFIINRDGVLFGAGAVINTAGFLASTNDIRNSDFMAGRMNFNIAGRPDASIVNLGRITATSGGFAALVAPGVRNSGTITATLGTVSLAAGNSFTLDLYGDRLITLAVNDQIASKVIDVATGKPLNSLVTNDGKIKANGGRVELTAAAARTVVDSVINTSGVIEANSIGRRNGMIVLSAATAGTKGAGAPPQTIKISGTLSAAGKKKGTKGGTIVVSGENIQLTGATVDASGRAGGGKVLIGGDWGGGKPNTALVNNASATLENYTIPTATTVTVDAGTTINASAIDSGNGGKVVLWSDSMTTFAGTILARGGTLGGDGGFVETSGKILTVTGSVNAGRGGLWLLDPDDLVINAALAGSISSSLNAGTNVLEQTTASGTGGVGNIAVNSSISWNTSATLTLSAYNSINIASGVTIANTASGNLVLRADNTGRGIGTVNFLTSYVDDRPVAGKVDFSQSTGMVSIFYNPSVGDGGTKYQNATDFSPNVLTQNANQLSAYMLVNDASDLNEVRTNLTGTYALGRDITDFSAFLNFAPIGRISSPFIGIFEGQGYTIGNLTIAPTNETINNIGLFGAVGINGVVRNLNLANIQMTANPYYDGASQFIGILAGQNEGSISNVRVTDLINNSPVATSTVNGAPGGNALSGIIAGGLVGQNQMKGTIQLSSATTNVTVGNAASSDRENNVGGLIGYNYGAVLSSSASGSVTGGENSNAGGLAGRSDGSITSSFAIGDVTGGVFTGGLVGRNAGAITDSYATGAVSSGNSAPEDQVYGGYGGLVGLNDTSGTILRSYATGAITLLGPISGYLDGGGLVGQNRGDIASSYAKGSVYSQHSSTEHTYLGGLVGWNLGGSIEASYATGSITGTGPYGDGGGLVGVNDNGTISQSYATGAVNMTGASSAAGGFVGINNGSIVQGFATGAVSVSDGGLAGGFAGSNSGSITQAYATGAVTGGTGSVIGGFVGANNEGGSLEQTYAIGKLTGGGTVGGLAGTNDGTVNNSYWDTQTTGVSTSAAGIGMTTNELISSLPPGFVASVWGLQPNPSYPHFGWQPGGTVPIGPAPPPTPEQVPVIASQQQVIDNLVGTVTFASLNTAPVLNAQGGVRLPAFPPPVPPGGQPPGGQQQPQVFQRIIDIPPLTETRFVQDEVVLQITSSVPVAQLEDAVRNLGLALLETQSLGGTTNTIVLRFHITNGQTVRDIIAQLPAVQIIAIAQPNYVYTLAQQPADATPASRGDTGSSGDAAQYALKKLQISDVHRIVRGTNVPIAVIDSEIDASHPDLQGVIAQRFSAVGAPEKAHAHGTGMAGAIASHQRLMGIAPSARLYAVLAFSTKAATVESTTFNILKGLDWAAGQGVRIVNMSFAGPKDPSLERAIKAAYDKGIVLIAAAGNAGPKSPPLYPGADPYVIAVTATDAEDKLFSGANRGSYISVAAPGVDILVPAPDGAYQLTTGTSVAAAEVSGIAALLLERNPRLTPADVRRILMTSAKKLGPGERDDSFGAGLVDPLKAVQAATPRTATTTPALRQR